MTMVVKDDAGHTIFGRNLALTATQQYGPEPSFIKRGKLGTQDTGRGCGIERIFWGKFSIEVQ